MPEVSVIVPTCARLQSLTDMLAGLARAQGLDSAEILVVDTGRQAVVRELCARTRHQGMDIRYVPCPSRALHAGRHWGARRAAGEVLLFADDDIVPSESWLAAIASAFRDPELALAGGECLPDYESAPPAWVESLWKEGEDSGLLFAFSLIRRVGPLRPISPFHVFGCNYAVRKSVLLKGGGFHPDAVPLTKLRYRGDGESSISTYVQQAGLKCLHVPGAEVRHRVPRERMTPEYLYRRYFMQAVSDSFTRIRRNGRADWVSHTTRILEEIAGWLPGPAAPWGRHARRCGGGIDKIIADSYSRGMLFHQREVRRDPRLLEWVLRPDYWDVGLPGEDMGNP